MRMLTAKAADDLNAHWRSYRRKMERKVFADD